MLILKLCGSFRGDVNSCVGHARHRLEFKKKKKPHTYTTTEIIHKDIFPAGLK